VARDERRFGLGSRVSFLLIDLTDLDAARAKLEELIAEDAGNADLHQFLGELAFAQRDFSAARLSFERALAVYREQKNSGAIALTELALANTHAATGDHAMAASMSRGVFENEGLPMHVRASAAYVLSQSTWALGQRDEARVMLETAEHLAKTGKVTELLSALDALRIQFAEAAGDLETVLHLKESAVGVALASGDSARHAKRLVGLAATYSAAGDQASARRALEEALPALDERSDPSTLAHALEGWGALERRERRFANAVAAWERALTLARELGTPEREASLLKMLGLALPSVGRVEDAERALEEALAIVRRRGDRAQEADVLWRLGMLAEARDRIDEAVVFLRSSADVYAEIGLPDAAAKVEKDLAFVSRKVGR
jgi:tetratricopeptide (TPR) repeat protein